MLQIRIETQEAIEELLELYGIMPKSSIHCLLRTMLPKLMETEECVQVIIKSEILPKWLSGSAYKLISPLKKYLSCLLDGRYDGKTKEVWIEAGYRVKQKSFADECKQKLKDPKVRAIDILKKEMPAAYRQQPYQFANRLITHINQYIRVLDLGDTFRFIKTHKKIK